MAVSNVSRKYKDPDNRGLRDTVPANENRRPVRGKVVPFPTGQASDSNPLHQTQDEAFSTRYQNPWTRNDENVAKQRINRVERQYAPAAEPSYRETRIPIIRKKVKHKVPTSEKVIARLKVSAINVWVGGWATFWYLGFQLPLALLSTAALGMAVTVYGYVVHLKESTVVVGFFIEIIEKLANVIFGTISEAISGISKAIFGIEFDPLLLFIGPFAITFILGIFQLVLAWFIYSIAGIKSLTGQGGGLKGLMFAIAGVGYALPILNLFPLIFLWMIMVWKYPK